MNFTGREQAEMNHLNVISLFNGIETPQFTIGDELDSQDLVIEIPEKNEVKIPRKLVSENQFPDQSMYVLDDQLKQLKSKLERLKFYLSELEDILPN